MPSPVWAGIIHPSEGQNGTKSGERVGPGPLLSLSVTLWRVSWSGDAFLCLGVRADSQSLGPGPSSITSFPESYLWLLQLQEPIPIISYAFLSLYMHYFYFSGEPWIIQDVYIWISQTCLFSISPILLEPHCVLGRWSTLARALVTASVENDRCDRAPMNVPMLSLGVAATEAHCHTAGQQWPLGDGSWRCSGWQD